MTPTISDISESKLVVGFNIRWYSPLRLPPTREGTINKYNVTWEAVHSDWIRSHEEVEKGRLEYSVNTADSNPALLSGETYEITVVSVSYDTYSVVNGSNQRNDTISKFNNTFTFILL